MIVTQIKNTDQCVLLADMSQEGDPFIEISSPYGDPKTGPCFIFDELSDLEWLIRRLKAMRGHWIREIAANSGSEVSKNS